MNTTFWVRRFLTVFFVAALVIGFAQILRGHPYKYAMVQGIIWGGISSFIFTATRIYRSRQGQHCAMCADTPEMQSDRSDRSA
jgi:hypothetical protein